MQGAEATVAVGLEREHIKFFSQSQSLLVTVTWAPFTLYNCLCI